MGHLDGPVVVTGAGKCFSAGVDLRAIVDGGAEYADRFITSLSAAFLAVSTTPRRWLLRSTGMPLRAGACSPWPRTCASCPPARSASPNSPSACRSRLPRSRCAATGWDVGEARRRRRNRRQGARQLDVGRHPRPHHGVYRRACTRLMTEPRARHGLQPLDTPGYARRRKCKVNLDDLDWDRPDILRESQQARGIPRNLQLDETIA